MTHSYPLPKLQQDSVNAVLGLLTQEIRNFEQIIKDIEDMIEVSLEYQCLTSVPGVVHLTLQGLSLRLDKSNILKTTLKSINMRN